MRDILLDLKITMSVLWNFIFKTPRVYTFLALFIGILFLLQWLFNIDQLIDIVFGDNPLSVADRIDFLADGFVNIFKFVDDIVPISMILIAFLQAAVITLLIGYRGKKKVSRAQGASTGLSLAAIGCVACGGSILTPLLGLVASNVSIAFAESVSTILLLIALVLSYISLNKVALLVAKTVKVS